MIGTYTLKAERKFRCGVSVIGIKEGAIVKVEQVDRGGRKVLVDFGGRDADWFSDSILASFEKIGG